MNKLPITKKAQIIKVLVEGMSLHETSKLADVSINTVKKLLIDTGKACQIFHDETVHSLKAKRIVANEIWSFVHAKEKFTFDTVNSSVDKSRDVWTWVGIDADSKLVISYYVGNRDAETAYEFINDIKGRVKNHIHLTTDGLKAYLVGVPDAFGSKIDYAQLIKIYGLPECNINEKRYSPVLCTDNVKERVLSKPNPEFISTSYSKSQYLTLCMPLRRFTWLTNAFSKKIENYWYAIALHFVYYNFCKIHKTIRVTPAMEAGLTKDVMTIEDIVRLVS